MPELKTRSIEKLVRLAIDARDQAYAPHSHFYVGAALLMDNGDLISGCNVENASYSLSICAERVAASTAVAMGHRSWRAIAESRRTCLGRGLRHQSGERSARGRRPGVDR